MTIDDVRGICWIVAVICLGLVLRLWIQPDLSRPL